VKIKKAGPRKLIKGAFIGNKGRTVFERAGSGVGRLPIRAVETIDVQQMFNTRRLNAAVINKINQLLPIEFARASSYLIARFNQA
jgi:hypothetical protein